MGQRPEFPEEGTCELGRDDIVELIERVHSSQISVLHLRTKKVELFVSKEPVAGPRPLDWPPVGDVPEARHGRPDDGSRVLPAPPPSDAATPQAGGTGSARGEPPVPGAEAVRSPLVGVFYRAPRPGEPPFVSVGDRVGADTTVGLVEAMKVFVAVRAGIAGLVVAIDAEDRQPVEYGQPVAWVDPASFAAGG